MNQEVFARIVALGVKNESGRTRSRAHAGSCRLPKVGKNCLICGSSRIICHHVDYHKPRLVLYLCRGCHRLVHNELPINGTPMATKKPTEIYTPSTVQAELGARMQRIFLRLRDELALPSDAAAAERAGLPKSYAHWLTLKRPWTTEGLCLVAAALNCTVAEMLAGDGREVAP